MSIQIVRAIRKLIVAIVVSALPILAPMRVSLAQVSVSVDLFAPSPVAIAPPPLPVYVVPEPPALGFVWTPGFWAWNGVDYYWVPGTWVRPPRVGLLWTPGYWDWRGGPFVWNRGYWGPRVGYYGGIHYGGGYTPLGFFGGRWVGSRYAINRSFVNVTNVTRVTNINREINLYRNVNVVRNVNIHRDVQRTNLTTSFNGGPGGTTDRPTREQLNFVKKAERQLPKEQVAHIEAASRDQALRAAANRGKPAVAATRDPGDFSPRAVVAAREAGKLEQATQKYNDEVRRNPALAKGAALPKEEGMPGENREQRADLKGRPQEAQQNEGSDLKRRPKNADAQDEKTKNKGVQNGGRHAEREGNVAKPNDQVSRGRPDALPDGERRGEQQRQRYKDQSSDAALPPRVARSHAPGPGMGPPPDRAIQQENARQARRDMENRAAGTKPNHIQAQPGVESMGRPQFSRNGSPAGQMAAPVQEKSNQPVHRTERTPQQPQRTPPHPRPQGEQGSPHRER